MKVTKRATRRRGKPRKTSRTIRTNRLLVREFIYHSAGIAGIVIVTVMARYVVTRHADFRSDSLLSIGSSLFSVASLLGTAWIFLFERTTRRHDVVNLLKDKHKQFFDAVDEDVVRLIEKSQKDARSLPGSTE